MRNRHLENNGLREFPVYRKVAEVIQKTLLAKIEEVKEQKEINPYRKDWLEIQVRLPGTNLIIRKEFCFRDVEKGLEEELENVIKTAEKNSKGKVLIFNAFLFPYEIGGRKLLENFPVKLIKVEKVEVEKFIPLAEEIKEIKEEVARDLEVSLASVDEEISIPESVERAVVKEDFLEEIPEYRKREIKVRQRSENFFSSEIDFDFREWGVWPKDGTRRILKKIFSFNKIETPNDLKNLLNNENPTWEEWLEFVNKLNSATENPKVRVGGATEISLRNWMRKNKMIPIEFRENI
ncbi:MAG: hypothetical protein ACRCZE_00315 [Candidatus Altimarinota bacterium]